LLHERNVKPLFLGVVIVLCMAVWFNTSNFPKTEVGSEKFRTPVQTLENLEMKKTLVAIAALAATGAFAQSTATIDGVVNYGVASSVAKQSTTGGWKGDRNALNFKVTEDMGAGNKLGVMLQTRFNAADSGNNTGYVNSSTGASGDSVFEQSKVTVDSKYGQVAVGRFTNAQGVADLHPFEDSAQTTSPHQAVNGRLSGQFQYTSPSFFGAQIWALNAKASSNTYMGSGTGGGYLKTWNLAQPNTSANAGADSRHTDLRSFGVNYTNGPLFVQVNTMTDLLNVRSQKIGATYDFGIAKVYVNQYNQKDNISLTYVANGTIAAVTSATTGLAAHKATEFAAKVPYGQFNFIVGHLSANQDVRLGVTDGTSKVSKNAYGVTYDITKRTQVMAYASNTKNGDSSATAANTNVGGFANGHNSFVGLQHSF
jgi:Gram-negative porin